MVVYGLGSSRSVDNIRKPSPRRSTVRSPDLKGSSCPVPGEFMEPSSSGIKRDHRAQVVLYWESLQSPGSSLSQPPCLVPGRWHSSAPLSSEGPHGRRVGCSRRWDLSSRMLRYRPEVRTIESQGYRDAHLAFFTSEPRLCY